MSTVLVIGGTGELGKLIVEQLLKRGLVVRLLVRPNMESAAKAFELVKDQTDIQLMTGDLLDPQSLDVITKDVDYIVATTATLDSSLTPGYEAILRNAKKNRVKHVVYISDIPRIKPLYPMFKGKQDIEDVITVSEVPYTILACDIFANLFVNMNIVLAQKQDLPVTIFCSQEELPNVRHCFVDESFVAKVTSAVVGNRLAFNQRIIVGGPSALTIEELVHYYNQVNGTRLSIVTSSKPIPPGINQDVFNILDQINKYESETTGEEVSRKFGVAQVPFHETVRRT